MADYNLAALARRNGRRRSVALAPIRTTQAQRNELQRIILRLVEFWRIIARERLMAEYSDTIRDSVSSFETAATAAQDQAARLVVTLTPALRNWAIRIEEWHRRRFIGGALTASGLDISTLVGPLDVQETVAAVVARNIGLVRNVSDDMRQRISDAFLRGFTSRTPAREVAREIDAAIGIGRRRARLIAGDQTVKLSATLDAERQRQAGIDEWIWRWSHKVHGRPEHIARDGKHYTDKTVPADLPGQLINCGCVRQSYLRLDED